MPGKSTLWQVLFKTLNEKLNRKVRREAAARCSAAHHWVCSFFLSPALSRAIQVVKHVMNPKALHRNELLGFMDLDTRCSSAARAALRSSSRAERDAAAASGPTVS